MKVFKKISQENVTYTPFVANKKYVVTDGVWNDLNISNYKAIYANPTTTSPTTENRYHFSISHLFYNGFYEDSLIKFSTVDRAQKRDIHQKANIFSIPYYMMGDKIAKYSVLISTGSISIRDDGQGNLYNDTRKTANRSLLATIEKNTVLDIRFWDTYKSESVIKSRDYSPQRNHGIELNVKHGPGIYGYQARFTGSHSYIKVKHSDVINPHVAQDFSVGCVFKLPVSQSDTTTDTNVLLTKSGRRYEVVNDITLNSNQLTTISSSDSTLTANEKPINLFGGYPYQLEVYNQTNISASGKVRATISDGNTPIVVTSSARINDNVPHYIFFQRTGSQIQLYVDGILQGTGNNYDTSKTVQNDSYLFIGSAGNETKQITGSLDQILITSGALDSNIITSASQYILSGSYYYNVGNVFYEHGLIVLSTPNNEYYDITGSHQMYYTESLDTNIPYNYGMLYNWYAIDSAKLAPTGYRVPSNTDITTLVTYLGGVNFSGGTLKSTRTAPTANPSWTSPNTASTNLLNLDYLPSGRIHTSGIGQTINENWFGWTTTNNNSTTAYHYGLSYNTDGITQAAGNKKYGMSVRFFRDATVAEQALADGTYIEDVQDVDGNWYKMVKVGVFVISNQNLKTTKYNDNTAITNVTSSVTWSGLTTEAYRSYDNNPLSTYEDATYYYTVTSSSLALGTFGGYDIEFRNTVKKTEVEVICTAETDEFNHSLNPSAIYDQTDPTLSAQTYATHSKFRPYVTAIGLYNDDAQLLAIAKLSLPVKRIDGMDTNFICRFDLD